jgi:predicted membrane channel-forming protein YqfA (hemolysin III family)
MVALRNTTSAQGVVSEGETKLPRAMSRPLTRGERVVDGWVNAIGLAAGVAGFVILIGVAAPESGFVLKSSLAVYGGALVAMQQAIWHGFVIAAGGAVITQPSWA